MELNSYKQLKIKSNHALEYKNHTGDNYSIEKINELHNKELPLFIYIPQINDPAAIPDFEPEKWPYLPLHKWLQ